MDPDQALARIESIEIFFPTGKPSEPKSECLLVKLKGDRFKHVVIGPPAKVILDELRYWFEGAPELPKASDEAGGPN